MKKLYLLLGLALSLSSCARETSSDVYDSQHFGEAATTYAGVIMRSREVTVKNGEGLQDNTTGIIGGAAAGALLGSTIGHGSGSVVAEVVGGLAGATGGAAMEQGLKTQNAIEYMVQLENGEIKTIVQAPEPRLHEGEKVFVMISHEGRSRVVAR